MHCVIKGCRCSVSKRPPGVSLHRFPRDEIQCRKWKEAIGQTNLKVKNSTQVCSLHFADDFLIKVASKTILRSDALPDLSIPFKIYQKYLPRVIEISSDDEPLQAGQELEENEITGTTSPLIAEINQLYSGYLEPQKFLSPYPIWHMQSYTTSKGEISTTPFSSAISRCTQTRKDSESEPDEPKNISATDTGKKKQLKKIVKKDAALIGSIHKAHRKLERLKIRITQNEEVYKNVKKAFRRADMRAERLQQQIDDTLSDTRQRRPRRKKLKEGTKRKKKSKAKSSIDVENQLSMKINNTVLCNENILDISQLASIADCVEIGQVIQLPILGTNESVNVLVGMPLNNTPNTIDNIVTNDGLTS